MKRIAILLIILMMLFVGFLSGCNEQETKTNSGNIIIVSHDIDDSSAQKRVYGTVKNVGDKNVDYAEVTVKFYDSDNELLITKKTQLQYIAKGETKNFYVYYNFMDKYFDQYDHYTVSVWSKK